VEETAAIILKSSFGVVLLIYVGFCWVKQGVHVKEKGWKSKEEMPKTFWFMISVYLVLALSMILGNIWFSR